jgi:hypothetical protein
MEVRYTSRRRGTSKPCGVGTFRSVLLLALEGAQFGECSLSHDGLWIVTAMKRGSQNGVALAGTGDKTGGVLCSFPRTIIHPQFHPADSQWVEFSGDPAPRMHRVRRDGSGLECLYQHGNDEFVVHETFLGRTGDIVSRCGAGLAAHGLEPRRISTIAEFNAWHITPNQPGQPSCATRIIRISGSSWWT